MDHPAEFDDLPLETLEEASGELHRRIALALRHIGEDRADDRDAEGRTPRERVAALAVLTELAATTCAAAEAGSGAPEGRLDLAPAAVAAMMYAAPTLPALVTRAEQDRRLLAAYARRLEPRFAERPRSAWGDAPLRAILSEAMLVEPARCAQALEAVLAALDAEERRLMQAAAREEGRSG